MIALPGILTILSMLVLALGRCVLPMAVLTAAPTATASVQMTFRGLLFRGIPQ